MGIALDIVGNEADNEKEKDGEVMVSTLLPVLTNNHLQNPEKIGLRCFDAV